MNKYEDSTQRMYSKADSQEYLENYEKIFGKKIPWYERRDMLAELEGRRKSCEEKETKGNIC
jgi:hypothetical protein